ncbi:Circadian clock protein kinase KaiC [uncultured archaeon]|nr:Circadian clock protein kinase KaiC [uncultured archaeon]
MEQTRVRSGIPGLDRMLGGGFPKNSVVAVAGGTGSGRTTFVSQFLVKGATDFSEPGLFLSFDAQKESIYANLAGFGWDMLELERSQKLVFIEYPQNELSAFVEQESAIRDLIETIGVKRVVIDSITPYALMFSTAEERRISTLRLVNAVKNWKVTCLISAESLPGSEDSVPHTVAGVESFADGFIHMSYLREGARRERAVEIVKMRGSHHEHEIKPAHIGNDGFFVGDIPSAPKKTKKVILDE